MYIHNIDNYKVVENDIEKVIKDLTNRANNILSRIDKNKRNKIKNKNGQIPYGYVIPKDKDKNKYRPVVSYYNHKYKKLLNTVSRGVAGMLKMIDDEKHCILWKTGDLHKIMNEKITKLLGNSSKNNKYIKIRSYDIKNFYTNLNHNEIRKAFRWLVSEVRKKKRVCKYVSVCRNKDEKVRFGSRVDLDGWTVFDFSVFEDVIDMDLEFAIFRIGDVLLQQEKGVPMGSPLSPILAILVAAYYESCFFENCQEDERKLIDGVRYVDDITILAVCDRNSSSDEDRIEALMDKMEN